MAKGYLYDNGDELITREDVNEVPDSSSAHAGDVLELDSNKKPKWSTPSGGGGAVILKENKNGTPITILGVDYYPVVFADSNLPVSWTDVNDYLVSGTEVYVIFAYVNDTINFINYMLRVYQTNSSYITEDQEYYYSAYLGDSEVRLIPEQTTELSKNDPLYLEIER